MLILDNWLSKIFNYHVYKFDVESIPPNILFDDNYPDLVDLKEKLQREPVFIYSKISTASMEHIIFLQQKEFNLIDTNVVFEKKTDHFNQQKDKIESNVRFANNQDESVVVTCAKESFAYSRFHLDPYVPNDIANQIKEEWLKNYFKGMRGNFLVVAETNGAITGFTLLLKANNNILIIDLIAVDKSFRKQGVASSMIDFIESHFKDQSSLQVGTQVSNIPSIRLYESHGFRNIESKYVFHYHNIEQRCAEK